MSTNFDPKQIAEKIVHEVKFQGVFDEFRKDSIADVDTKPAYLNLRQRVENAVQKFLSEQRWTPETNKYQLRDKLRRHITESGFLDVGVERIVDQVVNPKIGSVFQPRIEEIAYKYLGLPLPPKSEISPPHNSHHHHHAPLPPFPNHMNGNALKIETEPKLEENLLPKDLEQVSPDSDKTAVMEETTRDFDEDDEDEKADDEEDESPPFEPINECKSPIKIERNEESSDAIKIEIKNENDDNVSVKKENDVGKAENAIKNEVSQSSPTPPPLPPLPPPIKDECVSVDIDGLASQESQLSQISSETTSNQLLNQSGGSEATPTNLENAAATANISEEAQMPKFNENSDETTNTEQNSKKDSPLHFDIKKDEIKFEGTERKVNMLDMGNGSGEQNNDSNNETTAAGGAAADGQVDAVANGKNATAECAFHFTKLAKDEPTPPTPPPPPTNNFQQEAQANSSISSQDDETSSAQLCIVEKSELDTNSFNKTLQDESNGTINTQTKLNDDNNKHKSTSSSSSRHKKSSKSSRRTPERDHRSSSHRSRDDRSRSKYSDHRHNSAGSDKRRESSSSKHRHHSSARHSSSSSKRDEKRSSLSRSESQSRHSSSKKDYYDRHDSKKHRSHKSNRDDKDGSYKSSKNDDHNESKTKIQRRKSTDSNDDEGKNPNGTTATTTQANNTNSTANGNSTTTANDPSRNSLKNDTNTNSDAGSKHSKDAKHKKVSSSNIVILNEILNDPAKGFVELQAKQPHCSNFVAPQPPPQAQISKENKEEIVVDDDDGDDDLLYFEEQGSKAADDLKLRLSLINEAIDRCSFAYKHFNRSQKQVDDSTITTTNYNNNNNNNNIIEEKAMKATLKFGCFQYSSSNENEQSSTMIVDAELSLNGDVGHVNENDVDEDDGDDDGVSQTLATKRFKYDTECGMSKENQMNQKNAIKMDITMKKTTVAKRVDNLAKQRYTSEDLYKPRPVLSQRIKRRGLDA